MSKHIYNESMDVEKIDTGYLISSRDENYNYVKSAFPTWKEAIKWLESNPPKRVVRD